MPSILISTFCLSLIATSGLSQVWTFEYHNPQFSTSGGYGWVLPDAQGSYHSMPIYLVPSSGMNLRGSLVQLDNDGNVVSVFRAKDCEAPIGYAPFGKDQMISIGPDCTKPGISVAINIFNKDGRRIWHKPLDENYYFNYPIHIGEEIAFIQEQRDRKTAEDFKISVFDSDLNLTSQTISMLPVREHGHSASIYGAIRTGENEYLVDVRIFDISHGRIYPKFLKLMLVSHGKIRWIKSFENILEGTHFIGQVGKELLIVGYANGERMPIALRLDKHGNELQRWTPETVSKGSNISFYLHENTLMSLDVPINKTTLHISAYDVDGALQWDEVAETPYARLMSMRIIGSDRESFLVSGSCFETKEDSLYMGVVMQFLFDPASAISQETEHPAKRFSEEIIEELADEVTFVKVYPNPAQFVVNFEIDGANADTEYVLSIHDMSSKVLINQSNTGGTFSADVSDLPPATYVYTISTTSRRQLLSGKIVKQ